MLDETSPRAPFSLELPELGGTPITAAEARIPTANISTLRLRVRQPFADLINYGKIYTAINGESANTIQGIRSGRDGYVVTCDLASKPRFRLQPGKNVIEISAVDRNNRNYYASYVLLAGGQTTQDASTAGATLESVTVEQGLDRQPPEIYLIAPNGPVRLEKASETLKVRGAVTDESGALNFVKVNGQTATLSATKAGSGAGVRPGAEVSFATQSASVMAFECTINIEANSPLVIEAQDRAGNLSRLTLPVRRREAAISSQFTGRKFAVIIGVSRYKYHDGGLNDLEYADSDARAVRDFLQRREGGGFSPSDILYLENEQATSEGLRAALTRFLPKAGPNDLVFLFIAGHGAPDPYAPQTLYFLLHDTKVADMPRTALPMSELQEFLDHSVRAERVIVLIDACHSAGLSGAKLVTGRGLEHVENNVFNLYAAKLFRETGRAILTSSDVNEISQESAAWGGGHGVFTWALLEGLRGEADVNGNQVITAGELFDFVSNRVRLETAFRQNPRALFNMNKDFSLAVVPK
ncbi:MAG TPA: caspase family protein [Pyrinomonadaceae bacterium]|nr:caspase family protein [Pyrinomonadaceae bacterium]